MPEADLEEVPATMPPAAMTSPDMHRNGLGVPGASLEGADLVPDDAPPPSTEKAKPASGSEGASPASPGGARISCPACNYQGNVPTKFLGKTIKCPKCQQSFVADDAISCEVVDESEPVREQVQQTVTPKSMTPSPDPFSSFDEPAGKYEPRKRGQREVDDDKASEEERRPKKKERAGDTNWNKATLWILVGSVGGVLVIGGLVLGGLVLAGVFSDPYDEVRRKEAKLSTDAVPKLTPITTPQPLPATKLSTKPTPTSPQATQVQPPKKDPPAVPAKLPEIPLPDPKEAVPEAPVLALDAEGHTEAVRKLFFTPDGQQLITVSMDKTVRIWDLATGETVRTLRPPMGRGVRGVLRTAALSSDGKRLAVSGQRADPSMVIGPVYVISLETGQIETTIRSPRHEGVGAIAFSSDGKSIATALETMVAIYDADSGELRHALEGHKGEINGVAFSPDGKRVACISADDTGSVWSLEKGQIEFLLIYDTRGHNRHMSSIAWSADGKTIVTASNAQLGCVYYFPLGSSPRGPSRNGLPTVLPSLYLQPISGNMSPITSVAFVDSGSLVVTGAPIDGRGVATIIGLNKNDRRAVFPGHNNTVHACAVSKDGKFAATSGGHDHELFIWKTEDGSLVQTIRGKGRTTWGVGWSPDGLAVGWGNTNRGSDISTPLERSFGFTDLELGTPAQGTFKRGTHGNGTYTIDFGDNRALTIKLKGEIVHRYIPDNKERIKSCTIIGADRAVVGTDLLHYLVDLTTGKGIRYFAGHTSHVLSVAPSPDGRYFATGSADQTVRIWNPEQEEPLLSLFVADNEWIVWTQEGYYAASPGGERLMGWHVNDGPQRIGAFYPAAQFRNSLYRPDVIKYVLKEGAVAKALARADKDRSTVSKPVSVSQVVPPSVQITSPRGRVGNIVRDDGKLEVKATAKSVGDHPVTAMRLLINGRPYLGEESIKKVPAPKLGEVQESWIVDLVPGKHILAVQAESVVSKSVSSPIEVTRIGQQLSNLYVLAVGINTYPGEMRLNYAAPDADAVSQVLRDRTNKAFAKVEVKLVKDKEATRKEILEGLAWLKKRSTQRDVSLVFLSGHGTRDARGSFHFVPVDVNRNDTASSCISEQVLKKSLGEVPGRLILVLDACHSGAAALGKKNVTPTTADDLVRDLLTDDYGVIVLCSSRGDEVSLENSQIKHGLYTVALIEGLTGRADVNGDSLVYLHEVNQYTARRVAELSRGAQNPIASRPSGIRSFPISNR